MLITRRIRILRMAKDSWKQLLGIILLALFTYLLEHFVIRSRIILPGIIPTIIGTALAFFIGFNNDQAYDRWWEARTIWGAIVNNSRTWARQVLNYTKPDSQLEDSALLDLKRVMVKRQIAFLYALKDYLRNHEEGAHESFLVRDDIESIKTQSNLHNALMNLQSRDLQFLYNKKAVDGFQYLEWNKMIVELCNNMGQCERIRNTVFPTTYSFYTKFFIGLFIVTLTLVTSTLVDYWSVFFGSLIGYIFFVSHTIGIYLVDPFEMRATSLPLNHIVRTIEINLLEMLGETEIPPPVEAINGEYIM